MADLGTRDRILAATAELYRRQGMSATGLKQISAAAKAPLAMPRNAATGRHYSGINVLILWGAVIQHGFPGQSWLTFRQALSLGGNVRKGEHGTTVVYADRFTPEDEKRRARETGEDAAAIPFLKRFTVFNAAQCDRLPDDIAAITPPPPPGLIEPRVEALIEATGRRGCSPSPSAAETSQLRSIRRSTGSTIRMPGCSSTSDPGAPQCRFRRLRSCSTMARSNVAFG